MSIIFNSKPKLSFLKKKHENENLDEFLANYPNFPFDPKLTRFDPI